MPASTIIPTATSDPSPCGEPWVVGAASGVSLGVSLGELVPEELVLTLVPTKAASSESSSKEPSTPVLLVQASGGLPVPEMKETAAHCVVRTDEKLSPS